MRMPQSRNIPPHVINQNKDYVRGILTNARGRQTCQKQRAQKKHEDRRAQTQEAVTGQGLVCLHPGPA